MKANKIRDIYLFKSARLGFRNWIESDRAKMAKINANPKVMEFFPNTQDVQTTNNFIARMQKQFIEKGFCYFAVDKLENNEFIGFIGISEQTFQSEFTPCIDIGWRLDTAEWGKAYATEGGKRCLQFAFEEIGLESILSFCPAVNISSENVMRKIGMIKKAEFKHSLLKDYKDLENCVVYEIGKKI